MIIGRLKGGAGSGFFGHAGRKGLEGGSVKRGVLSSQTSQWRRLNIPDKGNYFEKVDKIIADPRDEINSGVSTWSSYLVTPDGEIYWCEVGHNEAAVEIIDGNVLTESEKLAREEFVNNNLKFISDNFLVHKFGFTRVMISKNELTFQTDVADVKTLRFLQNLYDSDKIDPRNNIVWVGALDTDTGHSPKTFATVNATLGEFLSAKYVVPSDDELNKLAKLNRYILKESRLKGGAGSGFHGHKGRKGLVGGSAARGVLSSDTKQFRFLVKDTPYMREVDTIPLVDGEYFILPDSRIIESLQYGHDGIGFDLMDLNMYELANGDQPLMNTFEDMGGLRRTNWFIKYKDCIRVEQTRGETNFETRAMDLATLRRLQKLSDAGKIALEKNIVWDGRTVSDDNTYTETHTTVRATYEEFMSAKFITIDGGAGILKEFRLKGGAGSGFHGHKGRLGEVGGSIARGVLQTKVEPQTNINTHDDTSPSDPVIKNPFTKPPLGYGRYENESADRKSAYTASWGDNENAKQSDYHPESQVHMWIHPDDYFTPLTNYGRNPIEYSLENNGMMDRERVDAVKKLMQEKQPLDAVWYDIDITTGKVTNQEGRHRAYAAYELGINRIPLIIYFRNSEGKAVDLKNYDPQVISSKNPFKWYIENTGTRHVEFAE